jgi:hypothetical protein
MWWAVLGVFVFIIAFFLQIFWWIPLQKRKCQSLNRRTGGRENIARVSASHKTLNRRIGGLEKRHVKTTSAPDLNRRIGGLEICLYKCVQHLLFNRRIGGLESIDNKFIGLYSC